MSLSRRFQNLILENRFTGAKSLHCVDLTRQLFGNTADSGRRSSCQTPAVDAGNPKSEQAVALEMRRIRVPIPIFTYEAAPNQQGKIDCFPLAERKMFWADHLGRTFLFDAETRQMEIVPNLHRPKWMPFSLFVPNVDADYDSSEYLYGSSLFVMEKTPRPEANCSTRGSNQFEAFVYRKATRTSYFKSWQCQIVPPPPYVRELKYWHSRRRPEIGSYAVVSVGNDSHICISVEGVGTYCLDMATYKWSKVGEWTLPFHGRVDYVPDLNLWLGFTTETRRLAAADLSDMESHPQLVGSWKELYLPEEWKVCKDPQLVSLGSGRFCIARFFRSTTLNGHPRSDIDQNLAVFTGVELSPSVQDVNGGSGKVQLQMISHKSSCYISNDTTIDSVF